MNEIITYFVFFAVLFILELVYFRVADRFNIIDKPNQRSSHTRIVLRGGGIIFTIALWIWRRTGGRVPVSRIIGVINNQ